MKQVQKPRKPLIVYYLIAIAVLILFNSFVFPAIVGGNVEEVDYGTFLTMVENKEVSKVQLEGESIYFTDKSEDSRQYETTRFDDPDLVNRLEKAGCKFGRVADRQMSPFLSMLLSIVIPMIIFILLGQFLSRQLMKKMGGAAGGNQFMQFGKSNAKVYVQSTTGITFNDVAGEDEAKELLTEIVDFLHNPQISGNRRRMSERRPPCGASGNRKDASCKSRCRGSGSSVFLYFGFGICRNVCRHGSFKSA